MKTVRFLHTSDIHLDTSFASSGLPSRIGLRKREAIRATFRRILEDARRDAVDFVLIAGDVFEHDRVTPDTVEFLKQQLGALGGIPAFIAPGNHDPFLRGSPYLESAWPENVRIFREEEFRQIPLPEAGVRVWGFGYCRTHVPDGPFDHLPVLPGDGINVVVCHASDLRRVPGGKSCHGPFRIESITGKNVRYCALGHYHCQRAVEGSGEDCQVWYSGIPEGRGWDEEGRGGYLSVEIGAGAPRVESRAVARNPLATLAVNCDGFATREQVIDAVLAGRGTVFDAETILRLRLEGSPDPKLEMSLQEIEERLAGEALHFAWEDRTLPALDFEALARENTLCGQFVRFLGERIAGAPPEERTRLERALLYGAESLLGRKVRLR